MRLGFYFLALTLSIRIQIFAKTNNENEIIKDWNYWCKKYNKSYENKNEESIRFKNWLKNYEKINEFNVKSKKTFKIGLNKFSDLVNFN
jgi:hypothetical protein